MQGREEEDALQGHGGSVQKKKGAMAAVLRMVRTAHGRRPGQQRLGLAERGVLAAFACEQERNGSGPGRSVMQENREEAGRRRSAG
jgi:hypothetical protein